MSARKKDNCKHLLDHCIGPVGWKLSEDANKHYSPNWPQRDKTLKGEEADAQSSMFMYFSS